MGILHDDGAAAAVGCGLDTSCWASSGGCVLSHTRRCQKKEAEDGFILKASAFVEHCKALAAGDGGPAGIRASGGCCASQQLWEEGEVQTRQTMGPRGH